MPVPTKDDLTTEAQQLDEKLKNLKTAYEQFLMAWDELQDAEDAELAHVHAYIDKQKIHNILQTIVDVNDSH